MNAMTYNNTKQYWATSILHKSDSQQQNIIHWIKTKSIFDLIQ